MHTSSKPTLWKHWPPQGQLRFIFTVLQFNTLYMLTCSPHRKRKIHVAAPLHQQLPWPNLSSTCSLGTITDFTIDYPHRLGRAAAPHALPWARQAHGPALSSPIHPPTLSKILPWASQAHGRAPPRGPDEPEVLPPPHPPPPNSLHRPPVGQRGQRPGLPHCAACPHTGRPSPWPDTQTSYCGSGVPAASTYRRGALLSTHRCVFNQRLCDILRQRLPIQMQLLCQKT